MQLTLSLPTKDLVRVDRIQRLAKAEVGAPFVLTRSMVLRGLVVLGLEEAERIRLANGTLTGRKP